MIVHAGLVAVRQGRRWRGVLIEGPSGSGKSDLALRMLDHGFRMIADDRVIVFASAQRVFGRAPDTLRNLIELRGVGVVSTSALRLAEVALVISCVRSEDVSRMPETKSTKRFGIDLPMITICPIEASAPAKLCRAVEVLGRAIQQDYDAAFLRTAPHDST